MLRRVVLAVALAATAWFASRWLFPSDEAQIRAVLDRIADAVGSGAREQGDVARLARAASIHTALDPDITVDAGPPFSALSGRDAIIGSVARFNRAPRDLKVELVDVQIQVAPDRSNASVYLTAEATFVDASGDRGLEARELTLSMKRREGDWVVSGVTPVRTLQPLTPR